MPVINSQAAYAVGLRRQAVDRVRDKEVAVRPLDSVLLQRIRVARQHGVEVHQEKTESSTAGPSVGRPKATQDDQRRPVTADAAQLPERMRGDAAPHRKAGSVPALLNRPPPPVPDPPAHPAGAGTGGDRGAPDRIGRRGHRSAPGVTWGFRVTPGRPRSHGTRPLVDRPFNCDSESPPTCELVNPVARSTDSQVIRRRWLLPCSSATP